MAMGLQFALNMTPLYPISTTGIGTCLGKLSTQFRRNRFGGAFAQIAFEYIIGVRDVVAEC